jgi:hypothetical protein
MCKVLFCSHLPALSGNASDDVLLMQNILMYPIPWEGQPEHHIQLSVC